MKNRNFFVVDIGNSFCKFACFSASSDDNDKKRLKQPISFCLETTPDFLDLKSWLKNNYYFGDHNETSFFWIISSVNQKKYDSFVLWIKQNRSQDVLHLLTLSDIPMTFRYDDPRKLGIDRAIAAFGASLLIDKSRPFFVVDVGTAATIDYVDSLGVFCGGAILPGPGIAVQALMERTEKLPQFVQKSAFDCHSNSSFPATNTQDAIQIGIESLFIGAIFSFYIKMIASQIEEEKEKSPEEMIQSNHSQILPAILITGRAGYSLEEHLTKFFSDAASLNLKYCSPKIKFCPNLILSTLSFLVQNQFRDICY